MEVVSSGTEVTVLCEVLVYYCSSPALHSYGYVTTHQSRGGTSHSICSVTVVTHGRRWPVGSAEARDALL